MSALSDEKLAEIDRLIFQSITELVFAQHHFANDQLEDGQNALTTAQLNISEIAGEVDEVISMAELGIRPGERKGGKP